MKPVRGLTHKKEVLKKEAGEGADLICLFKGIPDPAEDGVEGAHECRKTSLGTVVPPGEE